MFFQIHHNIELRSPLARALRGLFDVPASPDSLRDDASVSAALFVMACAGYSGPSHLSFAIRSAFPDPDAAMAFAKAHGFIEAPTVPEILDLRTVAELKGLAASLDIAITNGSKPRLIRAIIDGGNVDALAAWCAPFSYVKPSSLGCSAIRAVYDDRVTMEASVACAFSRGDADAAAAALAKYRGRWPSLSVSASDTVLQFAGYGAEHPVGLARAFLCPVGASTPFCLEQFAEYYSKHPDTPDHGFSALRPPFDLADRLPDSLRLDIQEASHARDAEETLNRLQSYGIHRCQWIAHVSACDRCKAYDDRIFDIKDARSLPVHACCGAWAAAEM